MARKTVLFIHGLAEGPPPVPVAGLFLISMPCCAHLAPYEERLPNAKSRPTDGAEHSFMAGLSALITDIRQVVADANA